MSTTFTPLTETQRNRLTALLDGNAKKGEPIYMGRDTSVIDLNSDGANEPVDDVINAVRSVPVHY